MTHSIPAPLNSIIQRVDCNDAPIDSYLLYWELAAARSEISTPLSSAEQLAVESELAIFHFASGSDWPKNPWNSYFKPRNWHGEDENLIYEPNIGSITGDFVHHWIERANECKHPALKARYADVAWDLGGMISGVRKNPEWAKSAIDAYLELVGKNWDAFPMEPFTNTIRALDLAIMINDHIRRDQARQVLLGLHEKQKTTGNMWFTAYDYLASHKNTGTTPAEESALIQDLESELAKRPPNSEPFTDPWMASYAGDRLLKHYKNQKNQTDENRISKAIGAMFEEAANSHRSLVAAHFFQKSIDAYSDAKLEDDANRCRVEMEKRILASHDDMVTFSTTTTISIEELNQFVATVVVEDLVTTMQNLVIAFLPHIPTLKNQIAELSQLGPLSSMFSIQLIDGNQIAAVIGGVENDPEGRLIFHAQNIIHLDQLWLLASLHGAIEKHSLTPCHFVEFSNSQGYFAEPYQLEKLMLAFKAWFDNDYNKSVMAFIPLIEYALRQITARAGLPTTKGRKGDGSSQAISMGDVVNNDKLMGRFGDIGDEIRLYFKTIYSDPRGMNLRNKDAHGLEGEFPHQGIAALCVHTLLLIGWMSLPEQS